MLTLLQCCLNCIGAEAFASLINQILEYYGFTEYLNRITMFGAISDSNSIHKILNEVQLADFNIIFGFFGPEKARQVLCKFESIG